MSSTRSWAISERAVHGEDLPPDALGSPFMPEERKLVTLLFADVTGSTALGEALDPEDVRALMGRYYQHARQVIADHGGTLEKFIGDAVMAIFGLPQAHGNDPERALAAAVALRAAVAGDPLLADRLLLRVGVNTGEVVATRDPSAGDFLVTGDAVNVAARLQQAANPGEILAGERTQAAGGMAFRFGEARSVAVKGKSRPLDVFPLVGPRPTRQLSRPPLVGRRRELAQLSLLRDAALEERHPQLVSIAAPAGTGKTRLLEEFLAGLDPAEGWQAAIARCLPYGQTLTYWPLRGLLAGLVGTEIERDRVEQTFRSGGHNPEEAARLTELVLATIGMERTGEREGAGEREATFNAWRLLVEALARQAPRIVVFEDLHWASESLLDLVEHIMHPRTRAPLVIVVLSRPELLDRRPSWGGGRRSFTALALEALSEAQTRQLIDQLVPGLAPEAARMRIVERSGGNPFFAIELARGLTEHLADPSASASDGDTLPDTVYEAVLARLDLLSEREREVLQVAAVAGRTFRPPTLWAALPERDPTAIAAALDGLLARDLVIPAEGEDDAYAFRHILFRDVAYGTLARAERIRLHMAVARWLEAFASGRLGEFVELLAYHYREAVLLARQSAVPLNVEVDTARAVHYLERAGELAGRVGAIAEARHHLEHAIALAPEAERRRLYEQLGDGVAWGLTAVEAYGAALDRWRAEGAADPLVGARLLRKILTIRTRWHATVSQDLTEEEMLALRDEARRLAEAAGDEDERWHLCSIDLYWPNFRGRATPEEIAEGRRLGPQVAAYFEARGDWEAVSAALDGYGNILTIAGGHAEAIEVNRRRLAAPHLSNFERGDAPAMLAWNTFDRGDYDDSIAVARQARDTVGADLPPVFLHHVSIWGALSTWTTGRWAESESFMDPVYEGLPMYGPDNDTPQAFNRGFLAMLHVGLAREDRAVADRALAALQRFAGAEQTPAGRLLAAYRQDDARAVGGPEFAVDLTSIISTSPIFAAFALTFLSERGRLAHADLLACAGRLAEEQQVNWLVRCVAVAQALATGDDARLAEAIDEAEAHGLVPHAARMRIVLAQLTGDASQLNCARPALERLGDRQFLRRLAEVEAALGE
jgi:class 3 adenylate cyclase